MSARFLAGVGAWLLGAGTATAGCLLAVSALGQGLDPAPSQQLSMAAVNRALDSNGHENTGRAARVPPISSSATPLVPRANQSSPTPAVAVPPSVTKVFSSQGGSVRAACPPSGAPYVSTPSAAPGYQASSPVAGTAGTATVTFTGAHKLVTMTISCGAGALSVASKVTHGDK